MCEVLIATGYGTSKERVSIASATPTEESADAIKAAQGDRLYAMNPAMQGARANAAASEAIKTAAGNEAGAMTGFMGMGMAMNQSGSNGLRSWETSLPNMTMSLTSLLRCSSNRNFMTLS